MKRRPRLLVVLWSLALACLGANGPAQAVVQADDAAAIRTVLARQQAAWNRGDIDTFMQGYRDAPDTTFVGRGVRKGYRVLLADYHKHYASKAQMGTLTFSGLDVRLLPDVDGAVRYAVVTGRFHLARTEHGDAPQDDGVFSLVWEKTARGWKIILDHTS